MVFDGRRDLFLCERCGADFSGWNVIDLQKELNKTTEYLFSLNKLSVIINYRLDKSHLKSNNLEYNQKEINELIVIIRDKIELNDIRKKEVHDIQESINLEEDKF